MSKHHDNPPSACLADEATTKAAIEAMVDPHKALKAWTAQLALAVAMADEAIMMEMKRQDLESSPAADLAAMADCYQRQQDLAAMADCYQRQQDAEAINKEALEILTDEIHRQPQDLLDAAAVAACQIAEQREELRELDTARDLAEKLKAANENTETALAIGDAHRTQREDADRRIKELERQLMKIRNAVALSKQED